MYRVIFRREPIALHLGKRAIRGSQNEYREYTGRLCFERNLAYTWLGREETVRVWPFVPSPFRIHAYNSPRLRQFTHYPLNTIPIESSPLPISQNQREHAHSTHEQVNAHTQWVIVEKVRSYRAEDPTRKRCTAKNDTHDYTQIEEGTMVSQQYDIRRLGHVLQVLQPENLGPPTGTEPDQECGDRSDPDVSYAFGSASHKVAQPESKTFRSSQQRQVFMRVLFHL